MTKNKRVLILGCSYSSGNYSIHPNPALGRAEICDYSYGWYDELPKDGYEYVVYSHNGGGYLQYADIIKEDLMHMENFDMVIIQETFEPRLSVDLISSNYIYVTKRNSNSVILNKHNVGDRIYSYGYQTNSDLYYNTTETNKKKYGIEPHEGWDRWLHALRHDGRHVHLIYHALPAYVDRMLEDAKIPAYAYSVTGNRYKHRYIKYIDAEPVVDTLFFNPKYQNIINDHPYHFNRAGTEQLGKIIAKGLDGIL